MKEIKPSNIQSVGNSNVDTFYSPFELHWAGTGQKDSVSKLTFGNLPLKKDTAILYHQDVFTDGMIDCDKIQEVVDVKINKTGAKYALFDAEELMADKNLDRLSNNLIGLAETLKQASKVIWGVTGDSIGFQYFDDSNKITGWQDWHDHLEEAFAHYHFIAPQWYFTAIGGEEVPFDRQGRWLDGSTLEYMRFSRTPIYPLVWLRYHNSNRKRPYQFLNTEDCKKIVRTMVRFNLNKLFFWDHFEEPGIDNVLNGYNNLAKNVLEGIIKS